MAALAINTHGDAVKTEAGAHHSSAPIPYSCSSGSVGANTQVLLTHRTHMTWPRHLPEHTSSPSLLCSSLAAPLAADAPVTPSGFARQLSRSQVHFPSPAGFHPGDTFSGEPSSAILAQNAATPHTSYNTLLTWLSLSVYDWCMSVTSLVHFVFLPRRQTQCQQ